MPAESDQAAAEREAFLAALDANEDDPPQPRFLYDLRAPYIDKLNAVARTLYGASAVSLSSSAERELARLTASGHDALRVCIAKTPLSLSTDADAVGVPPPFDAHVTQVRLAAGAGFVVALMGSIETMPGLPRDTAAHRVHLDADGDVRGLMQNE